MAEKPTNSELRGAFGAHVTEAAHGHCVKLAQLPQLRGSVHVRRDKMVCKFWLEPLELCSNHGFAPRELTAVRELVRANLAKIIEAWNEHCG